MKSLRTQLSAEGRLDVLDRVMAYRGGKAVVLYSSLFLTRWSKVILSRQVFSLSSREPITWSIYTLQDRRRIEREAFSGNLLGIVATTALELGVDIGVLDAVLMLGFPIGNLASFVSVMFVVFDGHDILLSSVSKLVALDDALAIHWQFSLQKTYL